MSLYSEMMGSFIRTGDYPIEANYIFPTVEELKSFFEDELIKTTLHKGLLKIVEKDENEELALYWVTENKETEELEFTHLVSGNNIKEILDRLDELEENLDIETDERIDDVEDLKESISELKEKLETTIELLKATVGTEEDDIIAYLETLDYHNLTELSKALHHFLNTIDEEDTSINTLPELKEFLRGFEYTHNLYECFVDFWNAIQGTPTPNTQFRTLRGIQDFVEALASVVKNRCDNLQTELDLTQVGVGLSGDGSYSADQETYYLKNATSVMNALKILDSLINEAINNVNLQPGETDTAIINIVKEKEKTTIYADVKVSKETGNDILTKSDGLYHRVDTEYQDGVLTVRVNGEIRLQHILGLSMIVESAEYDPTQEAIVIIFKLQSGDTLKVVIPAGALISEWEVDNSQADKVVELSKTRVVAGGADKLSADVRLSSNKYNILEKEGNSLIVDGRASNIIFDGDVTVESKINELVDKDSEQQEAIDKVKEDLAAEITRAEKKEHDIEDALTAEETRAALAETNLQNNINSVESRVNDLDEKTKDLDTSINAINESLLEEISNRKDQDSAIRNEITNAVSDLNTKIIQEASTRETEDNNLRNLINTNSNNITNVSKLVDTVQSNLETEIQNRQDAVQSLKDDLERETDNLSNKIDNVSDKVTTNTTKIAALELSIDSKVNSLADSITILKLDEAEVGFQSTYYLSVNGKQVGAKINVPEDKVVKSATIKEVQEMNVPYPGASVGDRYIEFTFEGNADNLYLPVSDLVIKYKSGDGIVIDPNNNTISAKVFINDKYLENSSDGIKTKGIDDAIKTAQEEVRAEIDSKAPIDSPILKGVPMVETSPDDNDSSLRIPSTAWVMARINEAAPVGPLSYWLKLSY